MLALYRCGRQTDALEQYRDLRRHLLDELGLEPTASVRELERAILQQDASIATPGAAVSRSRRLPTANTPLIGRRVELERLQALVRRDDVRLITLTGAGGSGKTRLALALVNACREEFGNGTALVELASIREPGLVIPAVAQSLGVAEEPGEPLDATLAAWLAERELLLVVDNVEHLVSAAQSLAALVAAAPRLTLLTTSRRVLHLAGEHVFPVGPLCDDDAVELFAARARAAQPTFVLTLDDAQYVREICRSLDGLPLAIELAAARSTMLSPRSLLERLGESLTALGSGPRDLPARQQTLRDTLAWSVRLLAPDEREVLARLTVFTGGCTLVSAESVCEASLNQLSALVDHSLLVREDDTGAPRFTLLETIREYASDLLGAQCAAVELRHALHFTDFAEGADLRGPEQSSWLDQLDAEQGNLRAALETAAAAGNADLELRACAALWRYWWLRGSIVEGRTRLESALERDHAAAPALRGLALHGAAGLAWSQGDSDRAGRLAEEALDTALAAHDLVTELFSHTVLGLIAKDAKEFERARHHLGESAAIASRFGSTRDAVVAKLNLATVVLDADDNEAAVPLLEDVLSHHEAHGSIEGQGFALVNLGLATFRLGRLDEARERFGRARIAFESIGFRTHIASALQGLAAVEAGSGNAAEAARLLGRADLLLGESGNRQKELRRRPCRRRRSIGTESARRSRLRRRVSRGLTSACQ